MSGIAINPNPAMCRFLIENTDCFLRDPIIIVDVGARDGFNAEWNVFGECMRVFCFEPDKEECERLNAEAPSFVTYIPAAPGRERKGQFLYEARLPYSTGLYPSRMDFFSRFLNRDNGEVVGQAFIWVETLKQVMAEHNIHSINFIKLDAEGAELDILLGASNHLLDPALFGIYTEIRFHPEINDSPPFWQVDQYMQAHGFRLFDISANRWSRMILPYPGFRDYFMPDGKRFYAYTIHGLTVDGDALYFRDILIEKNQEIKEMVTPVDVLKLAAFYELYHHNDAAAEVIVTFREQLQEYVDCDQLLDLLTPALQGEKLSYREYMKKYFDPRTTFAATPVEEAPREDDAPVVEGDSIDRKSAESLSDMAAQHATQEAALRAELDQVYSSTSWRVTKPMRAIKLFLAGK